MAAPKPKPQVQFDEEIRVAEFFNSVIVKPITKKKTDAKGLTEEEFQLIRASVIDKGYQLGGSSVKPRT